MLKNLKVGVRQLADAHLENLALTLILRRAPLKRGPAFSHFKSMGYDRPTSIM